MPEADLLGGRKAPRIGNSVRGHGAGWLPVLFFGAIGWPWLLRSLSDGGPEAREALLRQTGLAEDALPRLGSWRADAKFLLLIANHVLRTRPRTIVDLGGGTTTLVAAHCLKRNGGGRLVSLDSAEAFAAQTRAMLDSHGLDAEVRAAPLVEQDIGWKGAWYDHGPLPEVIDLLIVDGPPWFMHPQVRGAAATLFDRLPIGGTVMLDDAARPGERLVARRWRREWPGFDWRYEPGAAGTLIGTRER